MRIKSLLHLLCRPMVDRFDRWLDGPPTPAGGLIIPLILLGPVVLCTVVAVWIMQ